MNSKEVWKRIDRRLKAVGLAELAAGKAAGHHHAIRNFRRRIERGENPGLTVPILADIAAVLQTTPGWLVNAEGPEELDSKPSTPVGNIKEVPVISIVSAGRLQEPDVVEELNSAPTITAGNLKPGDWIGFRVEGHSMDRISPPASIILVNRKDKRLVANACYVIMGPDGEATYKRYRPDPMRFEPVSSDPSLEAIYPTDTPQVIGRVRRSIIDL